MLNAIRSTLLGLLSLRYDIHLHHLDAIKARGGEPFGEYQVPLAILTLQQGLGRLIRHRKDRGVLAILDPRTRTMGYGRRFIASVPPAPVVHELDAVEAFFSIV